MVVPIKSLENTISLSTCTCLDILVTSVPELSREREPERDKYKFHLLHLQLDIENWKTDDGCLCIVFR